jgi:amino-acid N-acetyltransferase
MVIRTAVAGDLAAVRQLLGDSGLPVDGVKENFTDFIVAEERNGISSNESGIIVGAIGIERYGAAALLRSAAVSPGVRGTGLGSRLVKEILERASAQGVRDIYLLTTTAEEYFPKFGFTRASRGEVPEPVKASREFQGACPDTAVVMKRTVPATRRG